MKKTKKLKVPRTFTIQDIRSWEPCYDPARYLPEDWQGTALDILKREDIAPQDKLWAVLRKSVIDDKTLRLFSVWCVREALSFSDNPDSRSLAACEVAERYAHGTATKEELAAAKVAAEVAARAAEADREADRVAAEAAWAAAWAAWVAKAPRAAWAAEAKVAAWVAAEAAWVAAKAAKAPRAAWAAAVAAEVREAQIKRLISMLEAEK